MNTTISLDEETALDSIEPNVFFLKEETEFSRGVGVYTFIKKTVVDNPEIENVCVCRLIGEAGHRSEIVPLREPYWCNFGGSEKVFPLRITTK